ncbi:hypothetical protein DFR70_105302 [Nocardia tenerifensis]|uniref:Uncharacterized protein n=1 Tax=Nocardia tenerifensis TaxID=228006 RepID=A0A318K076_9NOCA|nr:hypothetical protein DFR70_105302 [Nocardia tenerifensis]
MDRCPGCHTAWRRGMSAKSRKQPLKRTAEPCERYTSRRRRPTRPEPESD